MTLIVAAAAKQSIWLCADRRLTVGRSVRRDDATKILVLGTKDGEALLGYSGLGATTNGTEPSSWMAGVLRGHNLNLEPSLGKLAAAVQTQIPRHLYAFPGLKNTGHAIIGSAFLNDRPQLYVIETYLIDRRKKLAFRFARVEWLEKPIGVRPPRFAASGSGATILLKDLRWRRELTRLISAHENGKISGHCVADHFAQINDIVSKKEKTVGPNCIVIWRYRKGSGQKTGGNEQRYAGMKRVCADEKSTITPTIGMGLPVSLIGEAMMRLHWGHLAHGGPGPNRADIEAIMKTIPDQPNEKLN